VRSAFGSTISFSLVYNSYNADGSRTQLDTEIGWGWTHSYNIFLFNQFGNMFRMDGQGRVTKYQSAGVFVSTAGYFETLPNNLNGTFTVKQKDGTSFLFASIANTPFLVFGPVYRLTSITDRNNNVTTVSYDSHGNLTEITDTYGRSVTLSYNAQQHLTAVTDPLGRTTSLSYDSTGRRITQITDPLGKVTRYSYNTLSQITEKIDKDGQVFTYAYTQMKATTIRDGAGNSLFSLSNPNSWATDPLSLAEYQLRVYLPSTTSKTDGRGNVWKYSYESHGYVTSAVAPDGATTTYSYDPTTLMPATRTDADGNTTTYKYDAMGNLIQRTDALGFVTGYTYEPVFNQMTSMTDANGRVTTYQIDPATDNQLMATDPLGNSEKWTYDSHGNVLTHTDKNGHTTTTYDGNNNVVSTTDQDGHTTTYAYDVQNRLLKTVDALGDTSTTAYDRFGNVISSTDANGHTTTYTYDALNRRTTSTDAVGSVTTTIYDITGPNAGPCFNVCSGPTKGSQFPSEVLDGDGHAGLHIGITYYKYDGLDRRIQEVVKQFDTSDDEPPDPNDAVNYTYPSGEPTLGRCKRTYSEDEKPVDLS
jgi:YD repeat-containing protein